MKNELSENWIVCRVCLTNPTDSEQIFQEIFSQNASTRLDQMLHICAGIPVSSDDNFPDKMCNKCVRNLRMAYKFRLTCQRSHQHITDMLNAALGAATGDEDEEVTELEVEDITQPWEQDQPENQEVKHEHSNKVVIAYSDDAEVDAIIFDDTTDLETNAVVYDTIVDETELETAAEVENFAEYEELEFLTDESQNPSETRTGKRLMTWSEASAGDVVNNMLSSDDDACQQVTKAEPTKLLGRVRQPRKVAQRAKTTVTTVLKVQDDKKMGRKPRDKLSNYICDVCGNIYPSQARLTEHMKFHSGIKPHECEICGRGFVQNQQLVRHMNTHTGNRPYKCNFCPAAFADRSTKTKHHRIHTKERPYECDVCFKTFTYSDNLKFHKMIHTGEKPHVCDLCGKGFVKAYKMRLHRATHEKRGNWKSDLEPLPIPVRIKEDLSDTDVAMLTNTYGCSTSFALRRFASDYGNKNIQASNMVTTELVLDLAIVCRICLQDSEVQMISIYERDEQRGISISEKIESCSGIKINLSAELPARICNKCRAFLTLAYKFRQICRRSNEFLREYICKEQEQQQETAAEATEADVDTYEQYEVEVLEEGICYDEIVAEVTEKQTEEAPTKPETQPQLVEQTAEPSSSITIVAQTHPKEASAASATKSAHVCEICGNSYPRKSTLNIHMRRHRNERPYECEICLKAFHVNYQLMRHIQQHTGARPHICQYCQRSFTDRTGLVKHERTHRNERPYSCSTCGKTFTYANVLKMHYKTHTGEKPHLCLLCKKSFARNHNLLAHLQTQQHINDPRTAEYLQILRANTNNAS
ncbi:zinc finger protein 26 [Drosophila busckii]|nr:zinc finger protein 26 [Drosophila busckii]